MRLECLLAHAPVGLAMFDRDMRYLSANRRWLTDHGLEAVEWRGRRVDDLMPDIPARWREVHRRALSGERLGEDADQFQRADGTTLVIRWKIEPWTDGRGAVGGVILASEILSRRIPHATLQLVGNRH